MMELVEKYKIQLILIFLLFLIEANGKEINFTHITIEDGLSQTSVKCIFQDSQGFMWFGTADGLNRFDGYSFSVYNNDPTLPHSLSGNDISVIYENPKDSVLWIGTQDGGLNRFDRNLDRFIAYRMGSKDLYRIPSNNIRALTATSDGQLWVASYLGGLFSVNDQDSAFYQPQFSFQPGLKNINCLTVDAADNLWIGSNTGLYKWSSGDRKEGRDPQKVLNTAIRALTIDYSGNIWAGSAQDGLYVYHPVSEKLRHYSEKNNELPSNSIRSVFQTKEGELWIGTIDGLAIYDNISDKFTVLRNLPNDPGSLNNNTIYSIFEDHSGIIWVGTYLGGINKFDPLRSRFPHFRNFLSDRWFPGMNDVRSVVRDDKGTVWIGTTSGLIEMSNIPKDLGIKDVKLHFENVSIGELAYSPRQPDFSWIVTKAFSSRSKMENLKISIPRFSDKPVLKFETFQLLK